MIRVRGMGGLCVGLWVWLRQARGRIFVMDICNV